MCNLCRYASMPDHSFVPIDIGLLTSCSTLSGDKITGPALALLLLVAANNRAFKRAMSHLWLLAVSHKLKAARISRARNAWTSAFLCLVKLVAPVFAPLFVRLWLALGWLSHVLTADFALIALSR